MIQVQPKPSDQEDEEFEPKRITLEEFFEWYPDRGGRYELRNGVIVEVQPTGPHEQVGGFLTLEVGFQIKQYSLPLIIPRQCILKGWDDDKSGFSPDVAVLHANALSEEPLWKKRSTITKGTSVCLAIEVVSTNWRDDYLTKLGEYEKLGIPEYWIVDYLGLGGRRLIGNPKQPTITICQLVNEEYQLQQFQAEERLVSPAFPNLNLTVSQIVQVAE
ncbi:Uma2 family endonuclease [Pseudanabaena sp. PCC 6802]|uniref:Uma2 family endonuclease n=1 Tax=Pseudanabaena sp. PCC 6802 TaxID=118173 RepID=UPI00034C0AD1|nr:Uma2 family endonuclease [Pseudanabaena sp. PCC 6802]